jgi:hypothetical protein
VRKLQETLPYRPQRDRFKIFIVDEVHMLSSERVERVLEDARGAAAAREVHLRDDGGAQGPRHDLVAGASATTSS